MSIEPPKLPEPFDYAYKFTSPFGGEVWRMSSSAWNGNRPLDSTALFTADQLRAYGQEASRLALEAAAVEADAWGLDDRIGAAIRSLAAPGAGKGAT